jgi:hypothetical protein
MIGEPSDRLDALIVSLAAVVSLLVIAALCRRFAFGRTATILWMILGLIWGIPGLLTLLALRQFPARVPCPSCGRRRVVTRKFCEHCESPFNNPAMQGVEVFEMV